MQEEDSRGYLSGIPTVPREPLPNERLCINVRNVSFPANETGRHFHVNGITVNKTTQTVESAAAGGGFHIEDVYPLIDGGRFAVKRILCPGRARTLCLCDRGMDRRIRDLAARI